MARFLLLLAFFFMMQPQHGQQLRNPLPPSYGVGLQRVLMHATGGFIYAICQGQVDKDSAMAMATQMYGLGRLFPYNEAYVTDKEATERSPLDENNVKEAAQLLTTLQGEKRLRQLADLSNYYLHRPGALKANLDSADMYIQQLDVVDKKSGSLQWQVQLHWLRGALYERKGDFEQSQHYFGEATALCRNKNNPQLLALSLLNQACALPPGGHSREANLKEALAISKKEQLPLLQYRVLQTLIEEYFRTRPVDVEKEMMELLSLAKQIGFLHIQYLHYTLAYMYGVRGDLLNSRQSALQTIANMEATRDTALSTVYCMRITEVYSNAAEYASARYWNERALSVPLTRETQVFWYKNIFYKIHLLWQEDKFAEALEVASDINTRFPTTNDFDKMHMAYWIGHCYDGLEQTEKALTYYQQFLEMAARFPPQFSYTEVLSCYARIASFYFRKGSYADARKYTLKILDDPLKNQSVADLGRAYKLLFQLDSTEGNYLAAIGHYEKFHRYTDSLYSISQRKKMDELTVQYETKKKDQDIQLLRQDSLLQKEKLSRSSILTNFSLAGGVVLIIFLALLYNQYRIKQKVNRETLSQNAVLQQLLEEKEWLLREVHHRVKNNLQTIVSLLESQSTYLENDALLAIRDSQNRIHAMSLIHQKLYHNDNIASVDMGEYLPELIRYLCESYDVRNEISFQMNVQALELDVSQAIPIGLIVNEAVTNAIKYAFPRSADSKKIAVWFLQNAGEEAQLTIADNGTGIPAAILESRVKGLGLKLMRGLAKDIGGVFQLTNNNGTEINIRFRVIRTFDTGVLLPEADEKKDRA